MLDKLKNVNNNKGKKRARISKTGICLMLDK